jgi:hypothetical protein
MSEFDDQTQAIIDAALAAAPVANGDTCCGRVFAAFRALQARRQAPGASLDIPLAAAEHYMFARALVCMGEVSATQMAALVVGYDAKKLIDRLRGDANATAVTANPVSPPSAQVVAWGLKGVRHGRSDRERCNASADPPYWRPVEEIFGAGRGVRYAGRTY